MEREKWHAEHLPNGYPAQCDTKQVDEVIQDLNEEYYTKTRGGKNNVIWERLISSQLNAGRAELESRKRFNKSARFSMENPIVYIVVIVLLALLAFVALKFNWPLVFGST